MRTQRERREKILIYVKRALIKMSGQSEEEKTTKQELGLCDRPSTCVALGSNPTQKITA